MKTFAMIGDIEFIGEGSAVSPNEPAKAIIQNIKYSGTVDRPTLEEIETDVDAMAQGDDWLLPFFFDGEIEWYSPPKRTIHVDETTVKVAVIDGRPLLVVSSDRFPDFDVTVDLRGTKGKMRKDLIALINGDFHNKR